MCNQTELDKLNDTFGVVLQRKQDNIFTMCREKYGEGALQLLKDAGLLNTADNFILLAALADKYIDNKIRGGL